MDIEEILKVLKFNTDGLIPAIAQDIKKKGFNARLYE